MAQTVDELTFNYEDEGQLVRKEVKKAILSKGAWATVMFMFQELDRRSGEYRDPKIAIVRFKKSGGSYRKQSSFNVSSKKQARQIIDTIEEWYEFNTEGEEAPEAEPASVAPTPKAPAEATSAAPVEPATADAAPAVESGGEPEAKSEF